MVSKFTRPVLLLSFLLAAVFSNSQTINTVSGNGLSITSGDGGQFATAQYTKPGGMSFNAQGNMYICDGNRVRKVNTSGVITTIAGTGTAGFSGDGGPATAAQLSNPYDVVADASGNVYISDRMNARIRKVDAVTGNISTIAGGGTGYVDGAQATSVALIQTAGIAMNSAGDLFFADLFNHRIHKVDMTTGAITTYAGGGGIVTLNNIPAVDAIMDFPSDITFAPNGDMYLNDGTYFRIRRVDNLGMIHTVAGIPQVYGVPPPYTSVAYNNPIGQPSHMCFDASGNLYMSTGGSYIGTFLVLKLTPAGIWHYYAGDNSIGFAGDGGYSVLSKVNRVMGLAVDAAGDVYIGDQDNYRIRKVTNNCLYPVTPGSISGNTTVCATTSNVYSIAPVIGATSYQWTLPNGWTGSSNTTSINVVPAYGTGSITVAAVNSCGAGIPASLTVTADTINTTIYAFDSSLCSGQMGSVDAWSNMNYTYQWLLNGNIILNANGPSIYPNQTGLFSVVINFLGCTDTTAQMYVTYSPAPTGIMPDAGTICMTDTTLLEIIGDPGMSYQWYFNNSSIPGATDSFYHPTNWGDYKCVFTNTYGCAGLTQTVTMWTSPTPLLDQTGLYLSLLNGPFTTYQWYMNGVAIPGATTDNWTVTQNGDYFVVVTGNNGCPGISDTVTITALSVQALEEAVNVKLFPNPMKDKVKVSFKNGQGKVHRFALYNIQGSLVSEISTTNEQFELERGELATGLYYYELTNAAGVLGRGKLTLE